jgi:hypothetical protein
LNILNTPFTTLVQAGSTFLIFTVKFLARLPTIVMEPQAEKTACCIHESQLEGTFPTGRTDLSQEYDKSDFAIAPDMQAIATSRNVSARYVSL